MSQKIKGGGARKYERNKLFCDTYRRTSRREHNKLIKLRKHLNRFPNDKVAQNAVKICLVAVRGH